MEQETPSINQAYLEQHAESHDVIDSATRISNWIEAGRTSNAVAVYGTSLEVVRRIAQQGVVIPFPADRVSDEEAKWVKERALYYALPIVSGIKLANSKLAKKLRSEYLERINYSSSWDRLNDNTALNRSKFYATQNAISEVIDCGEQNLSPMVYLAREEVPSVIDLLSKDEVGRKILFAVDYSDHSDFAERMRKTHAKNLPDIIRKAFSRRGVLVYFSPQFLNGEVHLGREDDEEILIAAEKPFDASVITGIEVLSEIDMQALISKEEVQLTKGRRNESRFEARA